MIELIPYELSYKVYDYVIAHTDYKKWVKHILSIAEANSVNVSSILDIACGTGNFLAHISAKKYHAVGTELSQTMVEIAKKKLAKKKFSVSVADMVNFKLDEKFDLITCLFDSVNYLINEKDILSMCHSVENHLNKNALFVFDIVTQKACKEHFFNFMEKESADGLDYDRHVYYDLKTNYVHSDFILYEDDKIYHEHHIQKIYSDEEIRSIIAKTNFKIVGEYADFKIKTPERKSQRIHFALMLK